MFAPLLALAAAATPIPTCGPGEHWDSGMAMCMPGPAPAPQPPLPANLRVWDLMTSPDGCGADPYFELGMSMCEPRPGLPGRFSGMVLGNVFLAGIAEEGQQRGRLALSAPD